MRAVRSQRPAGAIALLLALLIGASALSTVTSTSRAAVPEAGPGQAVVSVHMGDLRTGSTSIGPLTGVTMGLFRNRPADASISINNGFTTATPDFTCVSDADGDCSFIVPIGTGAGEVAQGTRLWLAAVAAPPGYYANPYWETAPLTGGQKVSMRHVWPTPPLVAGQAYRSGSTWVTDPGLAAPAGSPEASISDYTRRVASSGTVVLSRENPDLPSQCGLNVALVADLSSSMAGSVPSLKRAMGAFVDALRGTPSQAALFTFGTDSPANGYPANTGLMSVATTADAQRVKDRFTGWANNPPTNYTNWDRGLAAVADANGTRASGTHFDLVVFITDGDPTVYGPNPQPGSNSGTGYTRFRELSNALASANLVKSQDTHILAVGVGAGVSGTGAAYNLRSISGRDAYDGTNIVTADYMQTADFDTASSSLRDVVLSGCAPSISVVKRIIPHGGTIADAYTPTEPWTFSATSQTPPATITPPSATTSPQTGATNFDVDLNGSGPGTFRIDETQQPSYTLYQTNDTGTGAGQQNAACIDKSSGTDVAVPVTNAGPTGFTVDVGAQGVISCVVYNRAPDFSSASVLVHKRWRVITAAGDQDYPNGAQPAGLRADLRLTGPGGDAATPQAWDTARDGYNTTTDSPVHLSESVDLEPPGCSLTKVTVENGAPAASTPASGTEVPTQAPTLPRSLTAGTNEWTFTNVVECHSYLTLHKDVASGPADPRMWTLEAIAPDGARPGPTGRDGDDSATHVEVTPDVAYQLAETPDAEPEYLSHYVQNDVRTRPLLNPESSGSWACRVVGGQALGPDDGSEGAITVPLGVDMECTATNNVATLIVNKVVQGGPAQASDFTFTVTPLAPVLPGGHTHTMPGVAPPGDSELTLRPGQHYQITESGPPGYRMMSASCFTAESLLNRNDLVLPPGATGACQFVNRALSQLSVRKVDRLTGEVLAGATFDLVRDANGNGTYKTTDTVVGSCTTGTDGTCSVGSLDFGTYFWVETAAPRGYQRPAPPAAGPIVVNATNAGTAIATATVQDDQITTGLSVRKVDGPAGHPIAGAVFQLYRDADGEEPGDEPAAADQPVGAPCTTPPDGTCTVPDLPFGDYYWYEVTPPPGYQLPADRTSPIVTLNAANAGTAVPPYQFTNPRLPGAAAVRKLDATDQAPLAGGIFRLYRDDGSGAYDEGDTLIGECTTNADGTCVIEDLDFGTYFWVETGAPIGYELPADRVSDPVVIDAGNVEDVQERTFRDSRTPSRLVVSKTDADDGAALAGARFELYLDADGDGAGGVTDTAPDPDDSLVRTCVTGENGRCVAEGLGYGTYYWFETEAPPGYTLPDDRTSSLVTTAAENAGSGISTVVFTDRKATWTATKSSDPPSGSQVRPGSTITYTLTARPLRGTAARGVVVSDDLSRVLQHAALVSGSIRTTAGTASMDGSTLRWTIPVLERKVTLTYRVRVDDDAWRVTLRNALTVPPASSGGIDCESADDAAARAPAARSGPCDRTTHTTPERPVAGPGPVGELADTGGPSLWLVPIGLLLVIAGAVVTIRARR